MSGYLTSVLGVVDAGRQFIRPIKSCYSNLQKGSVAMKTRFTFVIKEKQADNKQQSKQKHS